MRRDRLARYADLEGARGSKLVVYVTGDRPGLETQIHPEVVDFFVHHLDLIGVTKKISLFLYTCGGSTLASWSIVNLLRQFCDELEVIVPSKARSGGTLICLGADSIMMTKQATLGPIDPSVNTALNPQIPGVGPMARVPVSVEDINGYIEFAKAGLKDDASDNSSGMAAILSQLASQVHPLVLGNAYRGRAQIRMLAKRLLVRHVSDETKIAKILDFLCSESGSHDYTIFRREASRELGLKIEKPDDSGYALIKGIYDDIATELELTRPYDPNVVLGPNPAQAYEFRRGLVESVAGGAHVYVSAGTLRRHQVNFPPGMQQSGIQDDRTSEGWRHES